MSQSSLFHVLSIVNSWNSDFEPVIDEYGEPGGENAEVEGENGAEGEEGAGGTDDPDARVPTAASGAAGDQSNVVVTGDPAAAAAAAKARNTVLGVKEKRISNDRRATTPYMTKYERARVLGTRALQIRFVLSYRSMSYVFNFK